MAKWLTRSSVCLRQISRRETKLPYVMYYVYFLKGLKNKDLYVGSTENLAKRINLHNVGKVRSTKPYKPWGLLDYGKYNTRSEDIRRERFLKTGQQKELLKRRFGLMGE